MFVDEIHTAQKMKFSIKDIFSKCDQIRSFLRIWSHLLKKSLMKNFIFCAVSVETKCFLFLTFELCDIILYCNADLKFLFIILCVKLRTKQIV